MKKTTDGLPCNVADETTLPLTVSGKAKAGSAVPRANIREGVRDMPRSLPGVRSVCQAESLNFRG